MADAAGVAEPDVLAQVRSLSDEIKARGGEAEAGRRMPPGLIARLREAGVFRMFTPRSHGGLELDFPTGLEVIRAAARADGSAGWAVMIGVTGPLMFSRLPKATFDQIYADGPSVIQAGAAATPGGYAERAEGGYVVKGRWPFASGCQHADVILGSCMLTEGGQPVAGPAGPVSRIMVQPAGLWTIEDTWTVSGLKGTGSHHVAFAERFVPEEWFYELSGESCLPGPLYVLLGPWIPIMHAAFAVGLAEGAVEDLVAAAGGGRKQLFARAAMKDSPIFQYELGAVDAELEAARALFKVRVEALWEAALAGTGPDPARMGASLQAGVWITRTAVEIASRCFSLGGGGALYDGSPLQRRMRDMHAAAQHALVQAQNFQGLGAARLGAEAR
jgi:alkylation response protein AidB-like acyl-CoA dehydrogenase